jgi:hypothetical protein
MADTVFKLDPEIIIGRDTVNRAGTRRHVRPPGGSRARSPSGKGSRAINCIPANNDFRIQLKYRICHSLLHDVATPHGGA